ncbi:MAG: hypothetical protein H6752_13205 [Candidatus Omnitrophica bacterium]|nr:hypothetical protein [Candidatus Omnitrophota bacterium]
MSRFFWTLMLALGLTTHSQAEILVTKTFNGDWIQVDSTEWDKGKNPVGFTPKGTTLGYTVVHNDAGTGVGFDDPIYGPDRLATVNAVLDYIDSILLDDGQLDVEFDQSLVDDTQSILASAGPFFPSGPNGVEPGRAFTHITTGIDPSPSVPDIHVTVNFGFKWNSETDDPAGDEFDLYSVLLHELTHGLGFLSLIDSDGTSKITKTNPGVYATFDLYLRTGGGKILMSPSGEFLGTAMDITGRDGGVFFHGGSATGLLGSIPGILAPFTWRPGSSLSHWASSNPGQSVMISGLPSGVKRRLYFPYELGALYDLGYQVDLPQQPVTFEVSNWFAYE